MEGDRIPKIFISYSWSSDALVLELAQRLVSHGVDVVLDKWDLKEGQDKYAFMERCVNDPEITKVLIICDKVYAQKANDRTGGVGDETVIISSEIYGNMKQEKFIPVIAEKSEDGKPYIPTYIKTRIYIDLSDPETYEIEYEKLLRNIYENLGWAFGYNILGIPVAMGVLHALWGGPMLSPMIGGTAMALSSTSVVINALRLRFFK